MLCDGDFGKDVEQQLIGIAESLGAKEQYTIRKNLSVPLMQYYAPSLR